MNKLLYRGVSLFLAASLWLISPMAMASDTSVELFEAQCAGCHANGGNIIRRGKNLKLKTLEKNGFDGPEAIATIISEGKNNMSAYADKITPDEISALSDYVWQQAQAGWPA